VSPAPPLLYDVFSGAGGAAKGYHDAGFDVLGVDNRPQPRYPYRHVVMDAFAFFEAVRRGDYPMPAAWSASPPCQAYAKLGAKDGRHRDLIPATRAALEATGRPYVIENIVGAPLREPVLLCGSMFGLGVRRHRLFEANWFVLAPLCAHAVQPDFRAYYGKKGWLARGGWSPKSANVQARWRKPLLRGSPEMAPADMGISWMTWDELRQAIPPAYTRLIGEQLLRAIGGAP
jgi:DNA (cytosine-5)-methyltransferase 1